MRRLVCLLVSLTVLCLGAGTALAAPRLNAYNLQPDFICVSCHEPLNQVNSPEAIAEKQTLSSLVAKGLDYNQIKAEMVDIYTEDVLAKPPAHGINLLIYILPPLVLVGGLGLLAYNLPRWRRRAQVQAAAGAGPTGPPPSSADAERLDRELAEFDR
jgi:cytochrome c-type biogenesis protein CcmH/NrfF